MKLAAIGVVSCRGELYVYDIEWQFVSSPVEESCVCLELTAIGVVSRRGELDGWVGLSNWRGSGYVLAGRHQRPGDILKKYERPEQACRHRSTTRLRAPAGRLAAPAIALAFATLRKGSGYVSSQR